MTRQGKISGAQGFLHQHSRVVAGSFLLLRLGNSSPKKSVVPLPALLQKPPGIPQSLASPLHDCSPWGKEYSSLFGVLVGSAL